MSNDIKNVSAVYVWVTSSKIDSRKATDLIGLPTRKLFIKRPEIIWWWESKWRHDDDVSPSLEQFLSKDFPKMKKGLQLLSKKYGAKVELDWVLGLGNDKDHGTWPVIELLPETIAKLRETGFILQISIDDQISAEQLGINATK